MCDALKTARDRYNRCSRTRIGVPLTVGSVQIVAQSERLNAVLNGHSLVKVVSAVR